MDSSSVLAKYLTQHKDDLNEVMTAYVAQLETVSKVSPLVAGRIVGELRNQRSHLKLIASENYSSPSCHLAMGNLLTDKYAEGFAYHRYYAGCENVDAIEDYACKLQCGERLFEEYDSGYNGNDRNDILKNCSCCDVKIGYRKVLQQECSD